MTTRALPPNATIGIVGGGQLGRMSAMAAARLGYRCHVLTPEPDSPAQQVSAGITLGDYEDPARCATSRRMSMSSPSSSRMSAPRGSTCSPR